jgi:8-oxo-dGTP pyrophosphatase MutT (NUDIX family)
MKTLIERSAGGVVGREVNGQLQVALIATQDGTRWALPKGLVEPGEKPPATAQREVAEETGLHGRYLDRLGTVEYWYKPDPETRVHKFVGFYLFAYESGDVAGHDWEVDAAAWFPIDEAIERASYDTERDILRRAKAAWTKALGREEER